MKITELIIKLEEIKKEYGDLEIKLEDFDGYGTVNSVLVLLPEHSMDEKHVRLGYYEV